MPDPISGSDSNPYITAGYDRLKRLHQRVQCSNWQEKMHNISQSLKGSNPLETRTLVKGLCEEIAQYARMLNDDHTRQILLDCLACLAYSSEDISKRLSEIQFMKDKTKKHQALIQFLLSAEMQQMITEQLRLFFSNDASQSLAGNPHKKQFLENILSQGLARVMDYITVASNQDSYSPEGRIIKSLIDLLTMLFDVFLVNLGLKPAFTSEAENDAGHKPQTIMPMPMKI